MGLAERRAANEFETNSLPGIKIQIEESAGFALPLDIHWDQLSTAGESHLFVECWTTIYFEPLIQALRTVARDAMGKEALQAGLKRVVVQNTLSTYNPENWATFTGGTLTLDHDPLTNASDVKPRADALVNVLEAGL